MKSWFMVITMLVLLAPSSAFAKKKKKPATGIRNTGIAAFDQVFREVGDIDRQLLRSERSMKQGRRSLNDTLGLKRKSTFDQALRQLKRKGTNVVVNDSGKLEAPQNSLPVVKKSVNTVNTMVSNFGESLDTLSGVGPQSRELLKKTETMPNRLRRQFKNSENLLSQLTKLPKTMRALNHDIKVTKGLAGRARSLTNEMTTMLGSIKRTFGPS